MILACNHIEKKFNDEALFSDVSFHINEHECTALVGVNGTGKTTLLRIIVGELPADNGDVILAKDTSVGYLPQQQGYHSDKSIYDELWEVKKDIVALEREIRTMEETMQTASGEELNSLLERYHRMQTEFEAKDGYACKSQIMGIINGLGFVGNDIDKSINTLSGGQKTRVALGKLLLLEPDLLILDEPTNHLDLASIQWLETYLSNYKGSVLIVSHDRYFLDRIADKVVELDQGKATVFKGNYSDYAQKKELLRRDAIKQYENYQQTVRHQEQVIEKLRSFNREKSIKRAESREKMLEKMTPVDKPVTEQKSMHFSLVPEKESGKDVLRVENFGKSFGDLHLFQGVSFELFRGERVAAKPLYSKCSANWNLRIRVRLFLAQTWNLAIMIRNTMCCTKKKRFLMKSTMTTRILTIRRSAMSSLLFSLPGRMSIKRFHFFPVEKRDVSPWQNLCFPKPISCFSTSRPTTWILTPKRFWKML